MQKTYYIFHNNKVIYRKSDGLPRPLDRRQKERLCPPEASIFGDPRPNGGNFEVIDLPEGFRLPEEYAAVPLRRLLGWVDDELFAGWGKAAHLLHWQRSTRYCGSCGTITVAHPHEIARLCPGCQAQYYPAVSPCVIVLVHRRREILLARSPRFPEKMYSTLAGFIETGESAEQTIHREIREEVGVRVDNIEYFGSQPWPFPGQLMLGFFAEYAGGDIAIDGVEICAADWYAIDALPQIPMPQTIAGQLIRQHIARLTG